MIGKTVWAKCFIGWLCCVLMASALANSAAAQCGNYFKNNYHAVNKIRSINSAAFKMSDWTGDGKLDFWNLKANPNGLTKDVLIYPSKATGYWDWDNPIVYNGNLPGYLETNTPFIVEDFNSDGKTDILINNRIYQNVNNETLTALSEISGFDTGGGLFGLVDVNNDNLLDWISLSSASGQTTVGYRPGTADGAFGSRVEIIPADTGFNFEAKALGDFNGDGKTDIAYATASGYRILLNAGNGAFTPGALIPDAHAHVYADVADFNGDGRADILTRNSAATGLFILYGQTNGTFVETELPVFNNTAGYIKAAEFNGDNSQDIISIEQTRYSIYKNNGAGVFTRTDYPRSLAGVSMYPVIEDFSGDNKADYFNYHPSQEFRVVNAFGEEVVSVLENVCQSFGETKRANFDVVNEGDLVLWNTNGWASLNYDMVFNRTTFFNFGAGGDIAAPGDYDGDGKTDYATYRPAPGDWNIRRSSDNALVNVHFGLSGDVAVPNDYDGGGKTDIAVFRPSDGNWYILSSETQQVTILHFGLNGDKPVPADYDGDDKVDIAVFRPSEGFWYYYKSSDQTVVIIHWGIATDKPLPGDYDGDGRADLAVYRDGDWYVLRSVSYSYNFVHWGTATDIPYPLNRNGNSTDIVVYRPSTGYWYNSSRSFYFMSFTQPGYVPVYFGLPNN